MLIEVKACVGSTAQTSLAMEEKQSIIMVVIEWSIPTRKLRHL
jgi:hypothetical protein